MPCNFGRAPVFEIRAASRTQAGVSRIHAHFECYNPMFYHDELWSAELNQSTCFGLLSLHNSHACPDARIPDVTMAPLWFRDNIKLSMWLNGLQLSVYEHSRLGLGVSTILGDVMGSWNSKSIEQRWSDSGRRLGWRSRVSGPIFNQSRFNNWQVWHWRSRSIAPKIKGIVTKLVCIFCPNFVVLAWISGGLWRGQAQNGGKFSVSN